MHIQIDAQDPGRYRAAFRHVLRRRRLRRMIATVLLALLGVVYLCIPSMWPLGVIVLGLAVFAAVLPVIGARLSMRRLSRLAAQPTLFELTDQYVRSVTPLHLSQLSWAAFTRIEEIPGQLLLMPARLQVISVPTTSLTAEQLAELRAFLANWKLLHGTGKALTGGALPVGAPVPVGGAAPFGPTAQFGPTDPFGPTAPFGSTAPFGPIAPVGGEARIPAPRPATPQEAGTGWARPSDRGE